MTLNHTVSRCLSVLVLAFGAYIFAAGNPVSHARADSPPNVIVILAT